MEVRNIRLVIEYDGTRFHGWQAVKRESNSTISGRITEVLKRMTQEEVVLYCGEKTDAGVHTLRQIANFKTGSQMSEVEIRHYLNRYLPSDIAIREVETASDRFHAELNPHQSVYEYHLLIGEKEDVFQRRYVDFRKQQPDFQAMESAAEMLRGSHDFRGFSAGKTKKSTVRDLQKLEIVTDQPGEVRICLAADGFLKQMPQKLVGTLLAIGYGQKEQSCIADIFMGKDTAPAECKNQAFFLTDVCYD